MAEIILTIVGYSLIGVFFIALGIGAIITLIRECGEYIRDHQE